MNTYINKYLTAPIKSRLASMFVSQEQWEEWSGKRKFFFILANGRSGTSFLANLLNQAQGARVFHEPVLEDFYAYIKAFHNPNAAEKYVQGFRKKEIYVRMRNIEADVYGEVNGVLRCHAEPLKKAFTNATLIHLVRNGRDVVRSAMSRDTLTSRSPFSLGIYPGKDDPWKIRWHEMDRFSRICWLWQAENVRLRKSISRMAQFEKIISDYEYFQEEILKPCHILLDKKDWEAAVASPRNVTNNFEMPKWEDWTPVQKKTFHEICGEEMEKCGYESKSAA